MPLPVTVLGHGLMDAPPQRPAEEMIKHDAGGTLQAAYELADLAHAEGDYEFGVKVSVATPLYRCQGGQFVAHVKALPGNPYDGHTLATVVPAIESTLGAALDRIVTDAGYKGHNAQGPAL